MPLVVAQLSQSSGQLTLVSGGGLRAGERLVQRGGTTNEDLGVCRRRRQKLLQEIFSDKPGVSLPVIRGLVYEVVDLDLVLVLLGNLVEIRLQQDIVRSQRAVDQVHLGFVLGVFGNLVEQLEQGGDAGTTANQRDVLELVGLPLPLDYRALERNSVVGLQVGHVLGELALRVRLDYELNGALLVDVRNGCVGADDVISLGGDVFCQHTRRGDQPRHVVGAVKLKHIVLGVVGDVPRLLELQVNPLVVVPEGLLCVIEDLG